MVRRPLLLREENGWLYDERTAERPPTEDELEDFALVARKAIDASLELADELEAA